MTEIYQYHENLSFRHNHAAGGANFGFWINPPPNHHHGECDWFIQEGKTKNVFEKGDKNIFQVTLGAHEIEKLENFSTTLLTRWVSTDFGFSKNTSRLFKTVLVPGVETLSIFSTPQSPGAPKEDSKSPQLETEVLIYYMYNKQKILKF